MQKFGDYAVSALRNERRLPGPFDQLGPSLSSLPGRIHSYAGAVLFPISFG